MPNTIDLRKLKNKLEPSARREPEPPTPLEERLLETEEATHPDATAASDQALPVLLEWQALEFEHDAEKKRLLLILGFVLAIGGVAILFVKNFLFSLLLFIAGGLVASHAFRTPRPIRCAITTSGIKIGERLYLFEDLKSFWISYDPPLFRELIVESQKTMMPIIRAPLGDLDPLRPREILLRFLKEQRYEESLIDIVSKRLGF